LSTYNSIHFFQSSGQNSVGTLGGIGIPGVGGTGITKSGKLNVGIPGRFGKSGTLGGIGIPGVGGTGITKSGKLNTGKAQLLIHHGLTNNTLQGGLADPASNGTAVAGLPTTSEPPIVTLPTMSISPFACKLI
jgi:hypothetical protein